MSSIGCRARDAPTSPGHFVPSSISRRPLVGRTAVAAFMAPGRLPISAATTDHNLDRHRLLLRCHTGLLAITAAQHHQHGRGIRAGHPWFCGSGRGGGVRVSATASRRASHTADTIADTRPRRFWPVPGRPAPPKALQTGQNRPCRVRCSPTCSIAPPPRHGRGAGFRPRARRADTIADTSSSVRPVWAPVLSHSTPCRAARS